MLAIESKRVCYLLAGVLFCLTVGTRNVNADVGGGGSDVTAVSSVVHSVGDVESLFNQVRNIAQDYDKQKMKCSKIVDPEKRIKCSEVAEEMLKKAKDILARLNEEAKSVESEIAINKKRVNKVFARKLDRLLLMVVTMRQEANKMMKSSLESS